MSGAADVDEVPSVVYDCMVFLQAAFSSGGPASRCLELVEEGRVRLALSEALLAEIEAVLGRRQVHSRRRSLTVGVVTDFVARVRRCGTVLDAVPQRFVYPRDPKDEPYLNLAIAAEAAYLVSRDDDLLDLQDPTSPLGRALRVLAPQLAIVDPVQFLRQLVPAVDTDR